MTQTPLVDMPRRIVALVASLPLAFGLTACSNSSDDNDYTQICVQQTTETRVDDRYCNNTPSDNYLWWYYLLWATTPRIGQHVTPGGYKTLPANGRVSTLRPPATGGPAVKPKPTAAKPKTWSQPKTNPAPRTTTTSSPATDKDPVTT